MSAELGHFALVLALVLAVLQGGVPLSLQARDATVALSFAKRAAYAQLGLIALAFIALTIYLR